MSTPEIDRLPYDQLALGFLSRIPGEHMMTEGQRHASAYMLMELLKVRKPGDPRAQLAEEIGTRAARVLGMEVAAVSGRPGVPEEVATMGLADLTAAFAEEDTRTWIENPALQGDPVSDAARHMASAARHALVALCEPPAGDGLRARFATRITTVALGAVGLTVLPGSAGNA